MKINIERLMDYEFVYVLHETEWGPECKVGCGTIRRAHNHATSIGRERTRMALWAVDDCLRSEKSIKGTLEYYGLKVNDETERFNLLVPRLVKSLLSHLLRTREINIIGGMLNFVYRDSWVMHDTLHRLGMSGGVHLPLSHPDLATDKWYIVSHCLDETAHYSIKNHSAKYVDDEMCISRVDVSREDGIWVSRHDDGRVIERHPDGMTIERDGGMVIASLPSGNDIVILDDGSVIETNKHGLLVRVLSE